jgi:hypothetical protein
MDTIYYMRITKAKLENGFLTVLVRARATNAVTKNWCAQKRNIFHEKKLQYSKYTNENYVAHRWAK